MNIYDVVVSAQTNALKHIKKEDIEEVINETVLSDFMPKDCIYKPLQPMVIASFKPEYSTDIKQLKKVKYISLSCFDVLKGDFNANVCLKHIQDKSFVVRGNILSLRKEKIFYEEKIKLQGGKKSYVIYEIKDNLYHFYYLGERLSTDILNFSDYLGNDVYKVISIKEVDCFEKTKEGMILHAFSDLDSLSWEKSTYLLDEKTILPGSYIVHSSELWHFVYKER